MSSLYDRSRACVSLGNRVREYFEVRRGLRHGCVISPLLCDIFFDRVVRKGNEKATSRGVKMRDETGMGGGGVGKLNNYYMQMTQCW